MLSKSKGQTLRVAAVMHILFQIHEVEQSDLVMEDQISENALRAAIDFVQTSIQHAAYIAGRSTISKEVEIAEAGTHFYFMVMEFHHRTYVFTCSMYIIVRFWL